MAQGIIISKNDYNVRNCPDDKLVLDSTKEHLKIKYAGELNLIVSSNPDYQGRETITFNHNLGYEPVHYVFFKLPPDASVNTRRICEEDERYPYDVTTTCGAYVTKTQLVCWADSITMNYANKVINFKYYIFANPIIPQPLPRISSEGPWLDVVYSDLTLGVNFSKPSPTPGIIKDANYGDLSFGG